MQVPGPRRPRVSTELKGISIIGYSNNAAVFCAYSTAQKSVTTLSRFS